MNSLAYAALWVFIFALPWQNLIVLPGIGTISRPSMVWADGKIYAAEAAFPPSAGRTDRSGDRIAGRPAWASDNLRTV